MKRIFVFTLVFSVSLCGFSFAQNKEIYEKHKGDFDYDKGLPLNAEVEVLNEQTYYTKYHVYYDSVNGERVPGFLYIPKNLKAYVNSLSWQKLDSFTKKSIKLDGPPWPTIFIMHFLQSDKTLVESFAPQWATYGYAIFAIDGVLKGERAKPGKDILDYDPKVSVKNIRQQVIDIRRGADFLATREEIDFSHLGFMGVSMGAITGTIACGVDDRFKVIVLADGAASLRSVYENKSTMKEIQEEVEKAAKKLEELGYTFEEALEIFEPIDPIHYAPYLSPRPVLLINGKKDELFPMEAMVALHEAVGEPKKVQWFNSGHILPIPNVLHLTLKWFKHFLPKSANK